MPERLLPFLRRGFVVLLFSSLALSGFGDEPKKPYNVLFVMCDDLAACLGFNGNIVCRTPNLDQLAGDGVLFARAHCQYARCAQSRASLMTGRYPNGSGFTTRSVRREDPSVVTLPQLFRQNGYVSARVGKIYHMGVPGDIIEGNNGLDDDELSWDRRINCKAPEADVPGAKTDYTRKQDGKQGRAFIEVRAAPGAPLHDTLAVDEAIKLLKENRDKPFFLGVGLVRPHVPLVAPESFFEDYPREKMVLPEFPDGDIEDLVTYHKSLSNERSWRMSEEQQRGVISAYYACVSYVDREVGRLLAALDELKLSDRTIVVFTSDHGYHLGEHDLWQKRSLLEQTTHVPLILRVPGDGYSCGTTPHQVELVDLYPTLAELCGLKVPNKDRLSGRSLKPLLRNPGLADWEERPALCVMNVGRTLKYKGWRYVNWPCRGKLEEELYDLDNDPGEFANLAGDPEYREQLVRMRDLLEKVAPGNAR